MTAEILDQLRRTASRSMLDADVKARERDAARERLATTAIEIADRVLAGAKHYDSAVTAYAVARENYHIATERALASAARRDEAFAAFHEAHAEWMAGKGRATAAAFRNERALQEAQTEKEANNA
jgi:hypothetical protein